MTCKEALATLFQVVGKHPCGVGQYAPRMSFYEAQRFYNTLLNKGYKVEVNPLLERVKN